MQRVQSLIFPSEQDDGNTVDIISFDNSTVTKKADPTTDQTNGGAEYSFNKFFKSGATTNTNVRWNRKNEQVVINYKNKASAYSVLYLTASKQYGKYYKYINIPFIIMSIAAMLCQTIFATIIYSNPGSQYNGILSIISAIITGILTVITYWKNKTNYRIKSIGSQEASKAFSDFADEINTILTIPSNQRANPYEVLNLIYSDYKKLIKLHSNYQIPTNIYNNFVEDNKKNGISIDIFDNTKNQKFNFYAHPMSQRIITDKFIDVIKQSADTSNNKLMKELEKEFDNKEPIDTEPADKVSNKTNKLKKSKKVKIEEDQNQSIKSLPDTVVIDMQTFTDPEIKTHRTKK